MIGRMNENATLFITDLPNHPAAAAVKPPPAPGGAPEFSRQFIWIIINTGISSQLRAKLRDWAVRPVRAGCYSRAALSLTDSKTRYVLFLVFFSHIYHWSKVIYS